MWAFVASFQTGQPQSRFMQTAWGLSENIFKALIPTYCYFYFITDTCLSLVDVPAVLEEEVHS